MNNLIHREFIVDVPIETAWQHLAQVDKWPTWAKHIKSYWTRQWSMIDPKVTPERFVTEADGRIAVDVHQLVRDLQGNVLANVMIQHVYLVENGFIKSMEIRNDNQGIVKKVFQAFFSPSQYEVKSVDREIIERGKNYRIPFEGGELAVTTWGESGPAVLLVHGWGGARAQMTGFVNPLNETLTQHIHIPALMFHDTTDNVTPVADSRAIAKAWKSAQLIETTGLGHRGALQSKAIHEQVVKFLKNLVAGEDIAQPNS